jgi:hypothetical protein
VITYVQLGSAIVTAVSAIVGIVTAMINLRAAGQKKGDKKTDPIELVVRGFDLNGKLFDEKVLKLNPGDETTALIVRKALETGLNRHLMTPPKATSKLFKKAAKKSSTKVATKSKKSRRSGAK